jgi:hypothetical protein
VILIHHVILKTTDARRDFKPLGKTTLIRKSPETVRDSSQRFGLPGLCTYRRTQKILAFFATSKIILAAKILSSGMCLAP